MRQKGETEGVVSNTPLPSLSAEKIAKSAIQHVLQQIRNNPEAARVMGPTTQSWDLLTQAASALYNEPLEKVRAFFTPKESA